MNLLALLVSLALFGLAVPRPLVRHAPALLPTDDRFRRAMRGYWDPACWF
ncbi:MAG: hypothetical protein KY468_04790 [Armatimonadetes bacterium]|nr:hypothetical protein [Armatimonadota bacterium]